MTLTDLFHFAATEGRSEGVPVVAPVVILQYGEELRHWLFCHLQNPKVLAKQGQFQSTRVSVPINLSQWDSILSIRKQQ